MIIDQEICICISHFQAIKIILEENFSDEEEQEPQNMLYKNLWLEAEAALCSINYKARFARMKGEMKKYKQHQTKGNLFTFNPHLIFSV